MHAAIRSLARHTAVYGIGDLMGRAASFLLLPVYARYLSLEDNGIRALTFTTIGFCTVFYAVGLNQALVSHLSGSDDEDLRRTRFSTAYWMLLGLGIILSSALCSAAAPIARFLLSSADLADIVYLVAAILLLDTLSEPMLTLCRVRQRSGVYARVRVAQYSLQMGLTIYLVAGLGYGVRAVFWANVASSSFALLSLLPICARSLRLAFDLTEIRRLLAFGLPFVPSALAALVVALSDRYLIRIFLGMEDTGAYDNLYKLGQPVRFAVRAFQAAWAPAVLAISDRLESQAVCARVCTYFTASTMFFLLCVSLFSRELILLVAGSHAAEYLPGRRVVPLIVLAYSLYGVYVVLTAGVYILRQTKMLPVIVALGAGVNVAINLLLIPRIGYVAAAWSSVVAYGLMVLLLHLYLLRKFPVPYEYGRLGKVCVAGAIVYIAAVGASPASSPAVRGVFLLGYPLILWGWRFIEPDEWQGLRALVGNRGQT